MQPWTPEELVIAALKAAHERLPKFAVHVWSALGSMVPEGQSEDAGVAVAQSFFCAVEMQFQLEPGAGFYVDENPVVSQ